MSKVRQTLDGRMDATVFPAEHPHGRGPRQLRRIWILGSNHDKDERRL